MLKIPRIFAGLLVFVGAGVGVAHADDAVNASVMAAMAQPTGHIATTKYVRSITDSLNDTVLGTVNKDGEREGGLKADVAQIKASLGTVPIKQGGEQTGTVQIWVE